MANFTPQEIEEILQQFFDVTGKRQYIGARYVPIFGRKGESSIEWDNSKPYEPLTIVTYQGNSYTSRTYVPVGVTIDDADFWALTGNYNAQVEVYRQETAAVQSNLDATDAIIPKSAFSPTNTVKKYIDDNIAEVTGGQSTTNSLLPSTAFTSENTVKKYVDDAIASVDESISSSNALLPSSEFSSSNTVKKYIDASDAKLNYKSCVDYYGADSSGIIDSSDAIEACVAANHGGTIWFNSGTYKISRPIKTPHGHYYDRVSIDFNGATIKPDRIIDCVLYVGNIGTSFGHAGEVRTFYRNGIFVNEINESSDMRGVIIAQDYKDACFDSMNIMYFKIGIEQPASNPCDVEYINCYIRCNNMSIPDSVGIKCNASTDSKIDCCRIYGFKYAISSDGSFPIISNLHVLPKGQTQQSHLENAAMLYTTAETVFIVMTDSYCDTYNNMLYAPNATYIRVAINNLIHYMYDTGYQLQPYIINAPVARYLSGYCNIAMASNSTGYPIKFIYRNPTNVISINNLDVNLARGGYDGTLVSNNDFYKNHLDYMYATSENKALCWSRGTTPEDVGTRWYIIGAIPLVTSYNSVMLKMTHVFYTPRSAYWCLTLVCNSGNGTYTVHGHDKGYLLDTEPSTFTSRPFAFDVKMDRPIPILYLYVQLSENSENSAPIFETNLKHLFGGSGMLSFANGIMPSDFTPDYTLSLRA